MLGEVVDARSEQRNLDLGRARVVLAAPVLYEDLTLRVSRQSHRAESSSQPPAPSPQPSALSDRLGLRGVLLHLLRQGLRRLKTLFSAEALQEGDPERLSVEVAIDADQVG